MTEVGTGTSGTPEPVILLTSVSKSFGDRQVLAGASLEVRRGEVVAILGGSGSGKSVTLKTINGLIPVDEGSVRVLGHEVSSLSERDLAPLRRRVSYLFQGGALFDSMTVLDNVAYPLREHLELSPDEVKQTVTTLLDMVQLHGVEQLVPAELSGGMRKRVAVARALALEPEIILYDEPTTGLDPLTGKAIAELILDLDRRLGVTSVVVTHDIPLVVRVADRVCFLADGRFTDAGSVAEARRSGPETVREFFRAGGIDA
jgi:phospholipid/cholesterol/gamma-HCH transport system ATP-binding protein